MVAPVIITSKVKKLEVLKMKAHCVKTPCQSFYGIKMSLTEES